MDNYYTKFEEQLKEEKKLNDLIAKNLLNIKMSEKVSEKILWLIKNSSKISAKELAYTINCSSRTIERVIAKLKKEGRIKRIGPDKGGHWEVLEQSE